MEKKGYRPRIIDNKIEEYLGVFGALCIEGPKWCGKTWTSSFHSRSEIYLGDPAGNFQNRNLAELSPDLVLQGETPRLIDEWQEVPPLWDAVRFHVDQSSEKGLFILTGSSPRITKGYFTVAQGALQGFECALCLCMSPGTQAAWFLWAIYVQTGWSL